MAEILAGCDPKGRGTGGRGGERGVRGIIHGDVTQKLTFRTGHTTSVAVVGSVTLVSVSLSRSAFASAVSFASHQFSVRALANESCATASYSSSVACNWRREASISMSPNTVNVRALSTTVGIGAHVFLA